MESIMSCVLILGMGLILICAGLPLTRWVMKDELEKKELSESTVWALMIPVGLGVLSAIVRVVTLCDVTVKRSAYVILAVLIALFVWFVVKNRKKIYLPEKWFWIGLLAVILVCGIGYFLAGAGHYKAENWWDLTFYTGAAQDKIDYPISQNIDVLNPNTAYISMAYQKITNILSRYHRLSLTTTNAFATVIFRFKNAASMVGLDIILSHILIYCAAMWCLRDVLKRPLYRVLLSVGIACSPAIGFANQDCFLGFTLSLGMAMMWGSLYWFCVCKNPSWKKLIILILMLGYEITVFTEIIWLLLGISAVITLFVLIQRKLDLRQLLCMAITFAGGFLINIQLRAEFAEELTASCINTANSLDAIYADFARTGKGLTLAMFGKSTENMGDMAARLLAVIAGLLVIIGFAGIIMWILKNKTAEHLGMLVIMAFPLYFYCAKSTEIYMFYKMFLFSMPIMPIGWYFFVQEVRQALAGGLVLQKNGRLFSHEQYLKLWKWLLYGCLGVILAVQCLMTAKNTLVSSNIDGRKQVITPEWQALYDQYEGTKDLNIFFVQTSCSQAQFLKLYCKDDNLWVCDPSVDLFGYKAPDRSYYQLDQVPEDVIILRSPNMVELVSDETLRDRLVGYCLDYEGNVTHGPGAYEPGQPLTFRYFASKDMGEMNVKLTIGVAETQNYPMGVTYLAWVNDESYEIGGDGTVVIPTDMNRGVNEFTLMVTDNYGNEKTFVVGSLDAGK